MTLRNSTRIEWSVDAVVRNFEIIGEAGNHIPLSLQNQYPQIPWKQIVSMRNSLIHEYFGADNNVIWDTIQSTFQNLKVSCS